MRPRRNPEVVWRVEKGMRELAWDKARKGEDYEDIGVLTLMAQGSISQLNVVAAEIWTRINAVNSVEKIAAEVAALFEADPADVERDVRAFLEESERKGWVTTAPSAGPDRRWGGR